MRWQPDEDETLRLLWGLVPIQQIAERVSRTCSAIRQRAMDLEMDLGVAEGYISLSEAAKRAGYDHVTFRRAVRWHQQRGAEVELTALPAVRPTRRRGQWRQIDESDALEVARAFVASELASEASVRLGVPPWTLRRRAILLGAKVEPEKHLRLSPAEWDQAASGYRRQARRKPRTARITATTA